MSRFPRFAPFALLALAVLISTAGCKSNQNAADTSQTGTPDASSDPASANLAPVSNAAGEPQSASAPAASSPAASSEPQSAPPAADSGAYSDQGSDQTADDASYGEQPVDYAPQPPPALPEYQQPPDPGDDYLWTPGYWNYASAGYYWVPGVWVQAPYQGALWTPGYWGWTGGHYGFFRGYWGPHIGFYGGINYGFGYGGVGYQGGYWNSGHFFYNRSVNNINPSVVHNVYNYRVPTNNSVRVAFNGGRGGVTLRPRPAELAALREPHAPPMRAQIEVQHSASTNRAQFASENHGRPASAVIEKPLAADRDVHPVAAPAARFQPAPQQHGAVVGRPAVGRPEERPNAAPVRGNEPARPAPERVSPVRPEAAHPAAPHPPANERRPEERPAPHAEPAQPASHPPASQSRPEERPAPHAAPAQPASHPAAKPEERAAPHAAPAKPAEHPPAKQEKPKPEEKHPE